MALVLADRVQETSTSTGSSLFALGGAVEGFQTFNIGIGNSNTTYYTITDGINWMDVIGTYTTANNSLTVDTVLSSSAGGTTAVNFSTGIKNVFCTYPASKAVYEDASNQVTLASQLNLTNASNYNLYASGTGANYMAGSLGIGGIPANSSTLDIRKNITGATNGYGVLSVAQIQSDVTANANIYQSQPSTQATAFTLLNLRHFYANQSTIGTNSVVSSQYGYHAESTLTGATNNYGFYGSIVSGTGRYNLYMAGSADNYLAGKTGFGSTSLGGVFGHVSNQLTLSGAIDCVAYGAINTINSNVTNSATIYKSQPATQAASFVLTTLIHFSAQQYTIGAGSAIANQYGFLADSSLTNATNNNQGFRGNIAAGTNRYNLYMAGSAANYLAGDLQLAKTVTAVGTTGAQTINKTTGTVNFAAGAASLVVTNNLVTANSIIIATVGSNDTTMKSVAVVAGAGSFTLYADVSPSAETRVNFLITN